MERLKTEVLVVGGGTGGTAAAIQAARRGAQVVLVSEFDWLGGMLTSAGVPVPDGNELRPWQTGLWGAFISALYQGQPGGLDHSWVSCFSYEPRVGAQVFADWAGALLNLRWIQGQVPKAVEREGDCLSAVQFEDYRIEAQVIVDGTELGDLLVLGDVPYRWGWEAQSQWQEPSAPSQADLNSDPFYQRYPVQSPTWIVMLRDYGEGVEAPLIPAPDSEVIEDVAQAFGGAGDRFGSDRLLSYGQLPADETGQPSYMLNWPIQGNDYGYGLERLRGSRADWQAWAREAIAYSQGFAHYLQREYGRRYGLASDCFPKTSASLGGGAFALHPYYRESRRGIGLATVIEQDLLPQENGFVAALPHNPAGQMNAIALGNYPNDHHYPEREIKLAPKARRWGGRWTGTPFTIPYGALVPQSVDGLLFCEKNISVSHMANGATRLQPTVLATGQAVGMAAALCVEQSCQPRDLDVGLLQQALISDPIAPSAVVPLYNLSPEREDWRSLQQFYLDHPDCYPPNGEHPDLHLSLSPVQAECSAERFHYTSSLCLADEREGHRLSHPDYPQGLPLITLRPEVEALMRDLRTGHSVSVVGVLNPAGPWLRVTALALQP